MKTRIQLLALVASIGSGTISPAPAQVVNDGASRTLLNETNTVTGTVTVGTNGSFTQLILSDNALLTNSAHGVISVNASARSNEVRLTSPSARWLMGGTLFVGSNGPLSTLVVSNGAFVRANTGRIGSRAGSDSNVVVVTGSGSTWSSIGTFVGADLVVGGGGSGNQLIVRNGGRVTGNRDGIVGNNAGTSNNLARVSGSGSIWSNATSLRVGLNGTGNRLVIEAGGVAHCDDGRVGNSTSATDNEALVTGPGSLWTNFSSLTIGSQARGNRLVVSNGAAVKSGTGGVGSFSNQVVVTGIGSVWSNQTFLFVGGASNRVEVSDGGWLACNEGNIGPSFGANSNTVVLTGSGSGWNNLASLIVGDGGNGNVLLASNGATVLSSNATIGLDGSTANNNLAVITGAGTLWSNRNDLVVGSFGVGNRLQVDNGATVLSGNLFIGFNSLSANNRITVDAGTLRVTNAAGTGILDVRRGTSVLNGGLIETDTLRLTNSQGFFEFNGGTLSAKNSRVGNGLQFVVGNGVTPATFLLAGNGTHDFTGTLGTMAVSSNAVLTGNGTLISGLISGVNVRSGGTISPGTSIGKMTFSTPPSLSQLGTVLMEISKNGAVLTNDQIQVTGTLTYAGALTVSDLGPTALASGDRFPLFAAGFYAGSFGTISLPPLDPGLRWLTNLLVDGSIEVTGTPIAPPTVQTFSATVSATTAILNGSANPKGADTTAWFEWGFTTNYGNVTPPQPLGSGTNNASFSEALTGLTVGSYHFRAVAANSLGVVFGGNRSFSIGPTVQTLPAIPLDAVTATLNGLANPQGTNTTVWFEWGTTTNFGNVTPPQLLGNGTSDTNFSDFLTNLIAGITYHFRAVASNGLAVIFGSDRNFRTLDAYLKASNTGGSAQFATSVAISSDTVVVGAALEDSNATGVNGDQTNNSAFNSGAAYVFVRNGNSWAQQAYLKASNSETGDDFGSSVAISGDTIVVGTPFEDSNAVGINGDGNNNTGTNSGAAYVFVRNGTNWTQQAYLKASNTGVGDNFGTTVAVSGDTVVVGASLEDSNATGVNGNQANNSAGDSGAAYVFVRSGTNWIQQAYLKSSNAQSGDRFGVSVAASGNTVLVGAFFEDSNATGVNGDQGDNSLIGAGAAYVFVRNGTNWAQQAYLKASNTGSQDTFGIGVAASGDTVVVGAQEDSNATGVNGDQGNNSGTNSGAAYVFVRGGTNWTQQAYLKASNTGVNDLFGTSVALSGDTVAIGARLEDSSASGLDGDGNNDTATDSGAAYVFVRNGTNWTQQAYLKASNTDPGDRFGVWVSVSGNTVVGGADLEDSNATGVNGDGSNNSSSSSGAAYVFDLSLVTPPAPALNIVQSGVSQVTLSWTPPTPGFALQESLSLVLVSWSNSPSGETNPITIPATEPTKFFRLFKP